MNLWEPPPPTVDFDHPPKLIPGRTAADWSFRGGVYFLATLVPMFSIVIVSDLPQAIQGIDLLGSVLLILLFLGRAVRATFGQYFATKEELRANYTTLRLPVRRYVWTLDSKTGAVIRRPVPRSHP